MLSLVQLLLIQLAAAQPANGGAPVAAVESLDVTYSTARYVRLSTGDYRLQQVRTRLAIDGERVYFIEQVTSGATGADVPGREFLFDGCALYLSNSIGITKIYPADAAYPYTARLFVSQYADAIGLEAPDEAREIGGTTRSIDETLRCGEATALPCDGSEPGRVAIRVNADSVERRWLQEIDGVTVVTRTEKWRESRLVRRYTSSDFLRVGESLMPRCVTSEEFDPRDGTGVPTKMDVIVLEAASDRPSALPTRPILMTPGTQVSDARRADSPSAKDGALTYVEPMAVERLEEAWLDQMGSPRRDTRGISSVLGVLAGALAAFIAQRSRTC